MKRLNESENERRFADVENAAWIKARLGGRSLADEKRDCSRSPLGVEQVLYRYPNRAEPCFSDRLCPEEPNRVIHLPTTSHKIERSEMAKKRLIDWVYLGNEVEG